MIPPSALPPVTPAPGTNGAAGGPTGAVSNTDDEQKPGGNAEQGKDGQEMPTEKD